MQGDHGLRSFLPYRLSFACLCEYPAIRVIYQIIVDDKLALFIAGCLPWAVVHHEERSLRH